MFVCYSVTPLIIKSLSILDHSSCCNNLKRIFKLITFWIWSKSQIINVEINPPIESAHISTDHTVSEVEFGSSNRYYICKSFSQSDIVTSDSFCYFQLSRMCNERLNVKLNYRYRITILIFGKRLTSITCWLPVITFLFWNKICITLIDWWRSLDFKINNSILMLFLLLS